ncbi:MAG: chorismate synthase [Crenarchaeota archaeon]|nr:chorismate synthase [Thermoproteota archaeon]
MWLAGNSIGKEFIITSFGESHGKIVGVIVDGCPAGLPISESDIQTELNQRIPIQKPEIVSSRIEKDSVKILSGLFNGFTTGAPICMLVENNETNSSDYDSIKNLPRPSHADYPAHVKYGGFNDNHGGGRFSGRLTVALIMAGAVAKKILARMNIDVVAFTKAIGNIELGTTLDFELIKTNRYKYASRCPDFMCSKLMEDLISDAKKEGESLGGIIECFVLNVPAGVGEPLYDTLDADLAKAVFSVPAVKGVEFGAGFAVTEMKGSQANDQFVIKKGKISTLTNVSGGIIGGLSSGMPILLRVAIKPTPSIAKEQNTVDLSTMKNSKIKITGRHDPCVVSKAVPAIEAVVAITLIDHLLRSGVIPKILKEQ